MRRNFPKKVQTQVIKRATVAGTVYCESCNLPTRRGDWQIDHVIPDGLGGEPVLENAKLICSNCWSLKNPQDTTKIAKAKEIEAKHLGARIVKARPIQSAPMPKTERSAKRQHKPSLPPRPLYIEAGDKSEKS